MCHEHQRQAPEYVSTYERRNDNASDNLQGYSIDEEIYFGGYCIDRAESPTGGMVHLSFDVCPVVNIDASA